MVLVADGTDVDQLRAGSLAGIDRGAEVRFATAADLGPQLEGAQVLLMWDFFSTALAQAWPHADSLEWVHAASAGVDKLMFPGLVASDVVVTNARGIFDRPIAEFVLGSLLAHCKDMPRSMRDQQREAWQHRETRLLTGTRAMIVGTGAIGRETARLLAAVGVGVTGAGSHARTGDPDFGSVVASAELADHVGGIDWLVNIAPLTDVTRNLLDAEVFAALPEGAFVVNVGRGESLVAADLIKALDSGPVAGAALDVFATEPLPANDPLWSREDVQVSPHMSGDAFGWRDRLAAQFLDNLSAWNAGRPLSNVVDTALGYVPAANSGTGG